MRICLRKKAALCFLVLAAGLAAAGCAPAKRETEAQLIAQREEWAVLRGAPSQTGRVLTVSRGLWAQGALMLASPAHPLPPDAVPPDARDVKAMVGGYLPVQGAVLLRDEVIYALCSMQCDHSFFDQAVFLNGALSAAQQEELRREAFERYRAVYPLAQAMDRACAAVPGAYESEHQTGWAVDVLLTGPLELKEKNPLARNAAGRWMLENLWRYGLIQRYSPDGSERGSCESIHLRYVGPVHAAAMRALHLNFEDYLFFLHQEKEITLTRNGAPYAYIRCLPEEDALSFSLPENAAWTVSGDNAGFVILAIAAQGRF